MVNLESGKSGIWNLVEMLCGGKDEALVNLESGKSGIWNLVEMLCDGKDEALVNPELGENPLWWKDQVWLVGNLKSGNFGSGRNGYIVLIKGFV